MGGLKIDFARWRLGWLLVLGLAAAAPGFAGADAKGNWEFVSAGDGITVWRLDVPGKDLPGFRGKVEIEASISQIMDVMLKSEDHTKWMYKCKESLVLEELTKTHVVAYNRVEAPWPIWDRDVVMDIKGTYNDADTQLTLNFKSVNGDAGAKYKAVVDGVIRMPSLVGFYEMSEKDGRTTVVYEVESDIGGSIPTWLANLAAKDLPRITLKRLRARVIDTKDGKIK